MKLNFFIHFTAKARNKHRRDREAVKDVQHDLSPHAAFFFTLSRLVTFISGIVCCCPLEAANNGFYKISKSSNILQCAFCETVIVNPSANISIQSVHMMRNPDCPLLKSPLSCGNICLSCYPGYPTAAQLLQITSGPATLPWPFCGRIVLKPRKRDQGASVINFYSQMLQEAHLKHSRPRPVIYSSDSMQSDDSSIEPSVRTVIAGPSQVPIFEIGSDTYFSDLASHNSNQYDDEPQL